MEYFHPATRVLRKTVQLVSPLCPFVAYIPLKLKKENQGFFPLVGFLKQLQDINWHADCREFITQLLVGSSGSYVICCINWQSRYLPPELKNRKSLEKYLESMRRDSWEKKWWGRGKANRLTICSSHKGQSVFQKSRCVCTGRQKDVCLNTNFSILPLHVSWNNVVTNGK